MTLRKTAGLLAAFGLIVGLLGSGVGASFFATLTATENIDVGTFSCAITNATSGAIIAGDQKSVTYTAPTIQSSAAGNAPFFFQVTNTGSINQQLTISVGGPYGSLSAKFSAMTLAPASPVALNAAASQTFNTGIQWTALDNTDLGDSGSFTWTVDCGEIPPNAAMASTNANNQAQSPQWANFTAVAGPGSVTVTFHQNRTFASCFEYRTDGDTSQASGSANYNPGIHDGLYPFVCLTTPGSQTMTFSSISYVEVRMVFGAEADERFDWTRFNAN